MATQLPPVAILAGGLATRLGPVAEKTPKALVEVAGKPFIAHQLELLRSHDLRRVVICVGHLGDTIRDALGDGSGFGVSLQYSFDGPSLLGTAGALKNALPLLGNVFYVLYGDAYLECDYRQIHEAFQLSGKPGLIAVYRNEGRWDRSNVVYSDGVVNLYDKRHQVPEMQYIDYGVGILEASTLSQGSLSLPADLGDIYHELSIQERLAGVEVFQRFYEIGSASGLRETQDYLASRRPKSQG